MPTSFGIVAVEFVRSVDGVSHRALAGANHGVSGYVDPGQQQIQVAIALTNRRSKPMKYTVRDFQLRATIKGKTTVLRATAGDLPDGRILPDAGIEGHLDFTLPAADAVASLVFHDGGHGGAGCHRSRHDRRDRTRGYALAQLRHGHEGRYCYVARHSATGRTRSRTLAGRDRSGRASRRGRQPLARSSCTPDLRRQARSPDRG